MSHSRRQQERGGHMNRAVFLRTGLLAASFVCMSARAEWRCDCATIVDACSATITVEGNGVSIASDHRQCSRVDYLIDGLPFVALVVDGHEPQSWLTRSDNPRVLMQSCQVCLDNAAAQTPVLTPRAPDTELSRAPEKSPEPEISRLIAVDPKYPTSAAGTEGFVEIGFTVTALGRVENA